MNIQTIVILGISLLLSACGGGGSGTGTDNGIGTGSISIPKTISWNPPTENTDGTQLTDLEKYYVYYGPSENELAMISGLEIAAKDSNGNLVTSISISELTSEEIQLIRDLVEANDQHFFAMTAVNSSNLESSFSNIVQFSN